VQCFAVYDKGDDTKERESPGVFILIKNVVRECGVYIVINVRSKGKKNKLSTSAKDSHFGLLQRMKDCFVVWVARESVIR